MLSLVAELVADDARLGEAPNSGLPREQVEETEIEVDRPIGAAVERPDVLLGAACGVNRAREQHEASGRVCDATLSELAARTSLTSRMRRR